VSLNRLRTVGALQRFLVRATASLLQARRVLLVSDGPLGQHAVAARLPAGEDERALLRAVRGWLDEARRTRAARLRHGPDGVDPVQQRSCIVAPVPLAPSDSDLFLYADAEGSDGRRFETVDRDLLAVLAAQAGALAPPQMTARR
jgi:hypothetical protein